MKHGTECILQVFFAKNRPQDGFLNARLQVLSPM